MMHFWCNDAERKHIVKHLNPQACRANSDTSDLIFYAAKNVTLFTFPKLSRELLVYQEAVSSLPDSFLQKKSQWSFTFFLLAERIRGRNVRPCLLDWGISLMTPTCLHDTLGRREYSNKLGPRWASCGKKDIKVAFRSKKSGQMCHCCFSSPYHLFALGIENYIQIKGWCRVNKHISV